MSFPTYTRTPVYANEIDPGTGKTVIASVNVAQPHNCDLVCLKADAVAMAALMSPVVGVPLVATLGTYAWYLLENPTIDKVNGLDANGNPCEDFYYISTAPGSTSPKQFGLAQSFIEDMNKYGVGAPVQLVPIVSNGKTVNYWFQSAQLTGTRATLASVASGLTPEAIINLSDAQVAAALAALTPAAK